MPPLVSTWPHLVRLGWPIAATGLVRVTMRTVDILVVGLTVGATGVAALGIGDAVTRLVLMTALGLGAGTIATVSQRIGAGARAAADEAVTQSALLAALVGVGLAGAGWVVAPVLFRLLGAEPAVVEAGVAYLRIVILTAPARMLAIMLTRALQGAGDTRTPMVFRTVATAVNIALTVVLVPGLAGAPALGVHGAAYGTVVGNLLSGGLLVGHLARGAGAVALRRDAWWAPATARRIVRIGAPQVLERTLYAAVVIPLNALVLVFGTAANAGFQVGRRMQLYALLPSRGVATAVSTTMGNRVGAADPDAGDRYGRGGLGLALLVSSGVAAPLIVFAEPLSTLFVREPEALAAATAWVRIYAGVTVLRSVYGVLRGAMQGAGDTRSPLVASLVGTLGFALGFSWLVGLELGAGIVGVYLGVLLDPLVRTAILHRWYVRGRWRRVLAEAETAAPDGSRPPASVSRE